MENNSDDGSLELPKPKNNKETLDALKSLKKEKQALPKRQQSEKQKEQFAKAKQIRDENRALRAEAKDLLMKDKQSVVYTKEQKKAFKAKELEELKILLGKNKEDEIKSVVEKQTNKPKKVIEELVSEEETETETETESEEEVIVLKKKPKPRLKETKKKKKKVTVFLSSDSDSDSSVEEEQVPKQKSRINRPNQVPQQVAPVVDYKSYFV